MKIKKECIGLSFKIGGKKIILSDVMNEKDFKFAQNVAPHFFVEDKPKKSAKKKDVESDELE